MLALLTREREDLQRDAARFYRASMHDVHVAVAHHQLHGHSG